MAPKEPDYFAKHYAANRDKILDYKKEYYAEKVKYTKQFQPIKLLGQSKSESNKIIKKAINSLACFIVVNEKTYTPQEFYDAFTVKDFNIIEVEYQLFQDYELTIKIPDYYLNPKN